MYYKVLYDYGYKVGQISHEPLTHFTLWQQRRRWLGEERDGRGAEELLRSPGQQLWAASGHQKLLLSINATYSILNLNGLRFNSRNWVCNFFDMGLLTSVSFCFWQFKMFLIYHLLWAFRLKSIWVRLDFKHCMFHVKSYVGYAVGNLFVSWVWVKTNVVHGKFLISMPHATSWVPSWSK